MTNAVINWDELKGRSWLLGEIVTTSPPISGQKVASVNDIVYDWNTAIYRVSAVDSVTNIATLETKIRFSDNTLLDPSNGSVISALSMYMPNSATRVMYDKDVSPYTITTDPRYTVKGLEATEMRAFYGTDISELGEVISGNYNGSGNLVSDLVTLVDVLAGDPRVKRPPVFETQKELKSDDIITYVFYDAMGRKVGTQPFLVTDSGAIFDYSPGVSYISGIELRGDLIDPVDNRLINNHLNSPFQTALLEAWIIYNDGSEIKVDIDGNKCVLHGVNGFNTSILGYPKNVTLTYYCDPGEPAINIGGGEKRHISEVYKLGNIDIDTSFALKLFIIPEWQGASTGYRYKYYLGSLDGDLDADVTNFVVAKNSTGNNVPGTNHGVDMNITLGLDLDLVLPGAYPGHYHTQSLKLTTSVPGTVGFWPYAIDYAGDGNSIYGEDTIAHCSALDDGYVNIGKDYPSIETMLSVLYNSTQPLFDYTVDPAPPVPTHAVLINAGAELEIELSSSWDQDITCPPGYPAFIEDRTLTVKWLVRDGANDYIIGWSPLLIQLDL